MYTDIDFYKVSPTKQRSLVRNKRAATSEGLLDEIPDNRPAVRVFEKSLEDLILDRLESGRYTINELALEFEVSATDIRQIVNKYRRRGQDDFTGEDYKFNLLTKREGVLRVKDINGREFHYTLEKIPYSARVADPMLLQSLLFFDQYQANFPIMFDEVPPGMATEIDEMYSILLADLWSIDSQEIFDEITEHRRKYIETSLLPYPILETQEKYEQIRERFSQPPTVYKQFQDIEQRAQMLGDDFISLFERGQPGIRMYQVISIELFDINNAVCEVEETSASAVEKNIERIISTLLPKNERRSDQDPPSSEKVRIEEEIIAALDEDWSTAEEVLGALPAIPRASMSVEEVRGELDRLAGRGIVSKQEDSTSVEFKSESGTVAEEDVL
jgi:hypothetical protein